MKKLLMLGVAVTATATLSGMADVAMIEVEGEGAKYWTRWR